MDAPTLSRRQFLGASAGAAGALALPPSMGKVLANPQRGPGSLEDVEHVIFLMQENRSFDTYFGTLSGVRGFEDPQARKPGGRNVFYQPDPLNPDGYELPFHLDTFTTSAGCTPGLSHAWIPQHSSWDNGTMDGWITAHRKANGDSLGPLTMGYYERQDIPFHYALADAFTICDNYFCSVLGPTRPNRMYAQTGTIDPDGDQGGPIVTNSDAKAGRLSWTTYPEVLQDAGISWRMYQEDYGSMLPYFKQFATAPVGSPLYENGMRSRTLTDFANDVTSGNLPQVSWLNGPYSDSEHPKFLPANGALYVYNVLDILARNPDVWAKTVLFLTYDENDGYFDHVTPPTAPAGTPGEYLTASPLPPSANGVTGPIGLGFRVATIVISPWSQDGWVSSEVFDHTSMLRFVETRFGAPVPHLSPWRRSTTGDLTSTLRLNQHNTSFPTLPSPQSTFDRQEKNCATLPAPTVPVNQKLPHQEHGGRKRLPPHPHPH